jgi:hypothetical protein
VRVTPGEQSPPTGLEVQRSRALEEQVKQDTGGSACDAEIIQIGALLASEDIRQMLALIDAAGGGGNIGSPDSLVDVCQYSSSKRPRSGSQQR